MDHTESRALRIATGFSAKGWHDRISGLYLDAKRRHDGASLSIYGRVSAMLDLLDGFEPVPADYDLGAELNALAGELRRA